MHRVNYDDIAHRFDEPLRDHDIDPNLIDFVETNPALGAEMRILDVGCGTGKQLAANRARFSGMSMVGLDPFIEMLRLARKRCSTVAWVQGDGTELPFADAAFHYATNQFSYPHISDKKKLLAELLRVLTPKGRFVMTNIDPWSMTDWILYRYFPEAHSRDYIDFLTVDRFVNLLEEVGFSKVRVQRAYHRTQEHLKNFLAYASERYRASQFMAISDLAYQAGLERIRQAIANDENATIDSEFCIVTITADKGIPNQAA